MHNILVLPYYLKTVIYLLQHSDERVIFMKTSVIGYPRIGALRELKFASEKYFRKEITAEELQATAKNLRAAHWNIQCDNGVDFIPSNDFSFYDNTLDTAFLLNIIPQRYKDLKLSALDTYFAAARGYQGDNGDVKALAMKKWFNTNYHYMVPEIDDDTKIKLVGEKPFDEYLEARENGVDTKPVILGAFTLLKLARFTGKKASVDFVSAVADAYCEILAKLNALGAEWLQFDEPYLVMDLSADDKALFTVLYTKILAAKGNVKVLCQTYFGDVRDCYDEICALDFDGIGLDFIEGRKSLEIVEKKGFPKDKTLFAGVVNGKNIWRKGMLTGPVTILNWSFPREDISLSECAFQIGLAIREEVLDLEENGIKIIQVDEAALREKLPLRKSDWNTEYLSWAIPAFRLVHSGVRPETQIHTHMCYSEFADIIKDIDNMDADVITFEASRSDLTILDVLKENHFRTEVGPGVYDIAVWTAFCPCSELP